MLKFVAPVFALVLVGCVADVGEGKVDAVVTDASTTPTAPAAAVASTWRVDAARSSIVALGAKLTATHPIEFHDYTGEVGLAADGSIAAVGFVAQIATITSDSPRLTTHLLKEDFLFAEKYPTATFASTEVKAGSDRAGATHTVTGDLTIRGKTRRVTFPASIAATGDGVTASAEFVIDRQDFEVTYPGKPDDLVQDNVVLTIKFVAAPATT